jgi:phosphoribosylanthranilate isomerase
MIVKICGIRTVDQALAAIAAGADMIGLVFAPSKRRIDVAQATQITAAVHAAAPTVQVVGLFVNEPADVIRQVSRAVGLDMVQLSGDEVPVDAPHELRGLKTLRLRGDAAEHDWLTVLQAEAQPAAGESLPRWTALVDAAVAGHYGGSGVTADWQAAAQLAVRLPMILAGGLQPGNVAAAIQRVRPLGVDVSSGVERDGVKDAGLMQAFVQAAREAARAG